ncbi:MAG TPA: hypothetical protein VGQ83_42100 [Polyangia bacterium]|jgi:hypothetical protein
MSDDRFRIDPNTRLPQSIFEQPAPAPSPVARGATTLAAPRDTIAPRPSMGHHAPVKHHVDDTVREAAHGLHTIQEACERAKHIFEAARAKLPSNPREMLAASGRLEAELRNAKRELRSLANLAHRSGNARAEAMLPAARAKIADMQTIVGKARDAVGPAQAALRAEAKGAPRARAAVRDGLARIDAAPRRGPEAVKGNQPPAAGRLTRGLDAAHRVAGHPVAQAIGKVALGVGVALDAYQGWREYPSDSALHKTRAAGGYAAIGFFMSRCLPLALADIPLQGAISNTVKRAGQGLLVADHALVGRDPEAAKIYDDRVRRGDYGDHFQAGSRVIDRLLP